MGKLSDKLKNVLPVVVTNKLKSILYKNEILKYNKLQRNKIEELQNKEKVKVAFFIIHSSVWKYDELFKMMLDCDRFDPIIVICPYLPQGEKIMLDDFQTSEAFIKSKGYPYIMTYDFKGNKWINVREEINPDIVFFTNPHQSLTKDDYFVTNFTDKLTCYVPYSSMVSTLKNEFNTIMYRISWKMFVENDIIIRKAKEEAHAIGDNYVVTGFPALDVFLDKSYVPKNQWKHKQPIKIIWAPHHTVEVNRPIAFSSFVDYAENMILLAKKYSDEIQIAFKPHPLLYGKLCALWDEQRTNDYYNQWREMENTQFENSEYIDLFKTSDAMIFDSCSFVCEYLYTLKPSIFTTNPDVKDEFNEFGLAAFECHQKAENIGDVELFIKKLIEKADDPKKDMKEKFYNDYLAPRNNVTASQNIFNIVLSSITK